MITRTSTAFAILVAATPAAAQIAMYPGQEVQVNSGAASQTLLYPGGKYGRNVPGLLAPGQNDAGVIHLHMPVHRRARVAAQPKAPVASAAAAEDAAQAIQGEVPQDQGVADAAPAKPAPKKPAPVQTATAEPAPDAQTVGNGDSIPFSLDGSAPPARPAAKKPAARAATLASAAPAPRTTTPVPSRVVAAPNDAEHAGLTRRSQIVFPTGSTDPAPSEMEGIKGLAAALNSALKAGAQRVQLEAYGGPHGDKSSDSRRLSLKRALSIRQTLIDDGVPAEKIDVRAMGGVDDRGPADRVDVYLRAG
ncbi:MAG TPA: OmpA family protein [Rhizomicrobium sp.]|jgi:outer membrane protein OmpA-like peptidoglycan-associated protein|nr:OmpA family protein [Rhizomicrobium sp.]